MLAVQSPTGPLPWRYLCWCILVPLAHLRKSVLYTGRNAHNYRWRDQRSLAGLGRSLLVFQPPGTRKGRHYISSVLGIVTTASPIVTFSPFWFCAQHSIVTDSCVLPAGKASM